MGFNQRSVRVFLAHTLRAFALAAFRATSMLVVLALVIGVMSVLGQSILVFPAAAWSTFSGKGRKPAAIPAGVESILIRSADQVRLEVWRLSSRLNYGDGAHIALFLHGNGNTIASAFYIQKQLSDLGFTTYSLDYRGFGISSGWPSENGIYQDSEAVWNYILDREKISAQKVMIVGHSLGTGPAAYLAAQHQPAALALVAPYSSLPEVVNEMPLYRYLLPFFVYNFPTDKFVSELRATCLYVGYGGVDSVIPPKLSSKVFDHYRGSATHFKRQFKNDGHVSLMRSALSDAVLKLSGCFDS